MATILVSTVGQLEAALVNARGGDVIKLAAGNYDAVRIRGFDFASDVTITSADADHPATLTSLLVRDSSGLRFTDLAMTAGLAAENNPFQVMGSDHVSFDNITVSGPALDPDTDGLSLFMIRNSTDISVSNSEFSNGWHGISLLDNDGVKVSGSSFHDLRTDGIRGGGNSNLVIDGNLFTDFYPQPGDHPDGIQLWTTNTTETARNITITDNLVVRGDGAPVQGIFIRDTFNSLPFENITVEGNLIAGGIYNGISLSGVIGGRIKDNVVAGFEDQKSWIRVVNSQGIAVTGNTSTDYILTAGNTSVQSNNSWILSPEDEGARLASRWLSQNLDFSGSWGSYGEVMAKLGLIVPTTAERSADELVLVRGTSGDDRLNVSLVGNSRIEGGSGNDTLNSGGARSELVGGSGDDVYVVKHANTTLIEQAGQGTDTVMAHVNVTLSSHIENLRVMVEGLTVRGNAGDNRFTGSAGVDTIHALGGDDTVTAGDGNDEVWGGAGVDKLLGDNGNDKLYGEAGNDRLLGGHGIDTLDGGAGDDTLEGGIGNDILTGGTGIDTFFYRNGDLGGSGYETITDFQRGQDRISLSMIDAKTRTNDDDAFRFIGTGAFTGRAGELRYQAVGGNAIVTGDTNGDGVADFAIKLLNVTTLASSDFVL